MASLTKTYVPQPITGYTLELTPDEYEALKAVIHGLMGSTILATGKTVGGSHVFNSWGEVTRAALVAINTAICGV